MILLQFLGELLTIFGAVLFTLTAVSGLCFALFIGLSDLLNLTKK